MNQNKSASIGSSGIDEVFSRPRYKHAIRIVGVVIIVFLNVALIMSHVERHARHADLPLMKELLNYLLLIFIDSTLLIPMIFEVDSIEALNDKIIVRTMFWKAAIPWKQIQEWKCPQYFKFGWLRSARCIYLVKKPDFKQFERLSQTINEHLQRRDS